MHQEFGRTDILVNNAGVMLLGPFIAEQRAEHRQMVEVNLLGAMTTTEVFLDQLRDGGGLVNIPRSPAGQPGQPVRAAPSTPPPRPAWAAGPRYSARNCSPVCA